MRCLHGCCVWVSPNVVLNIVPKVFVACSDATFYITVECDLESSLNYAPISLGCWTLYFTHLFSLTMCWYTTLLLIWLLFISGSLPQLVFVLFFSPHIQTVAADDCASLSLVLLEISDYWRFLCFLCTILLLGSRSYNIKCFETTAVVVSVI